MICKVIDKLLENVEKENIIGIGAAAPGIIDSDNGVVVFSPNMEWENYNLKKELEEKYGIEVFLGNDVNIGTLGEYLYGAGQGTKNIVGIFVGTGVGGGIIIDGKVYGGNIGAAGEIGHIVLNPDGPLCGCGARGCLESYGSKTAMQKEILAQIERGRDTVLKEVLTNGDSNIIKSESLKLGYENGDDVTVDAVNNASRYLGAGVATVMNMLNPEMIVLGGGVIESMGDIIIPMIKQTKDFDWSLNNTITWENTFKEKHRTILTLVQEAEERSSWTDRIEARNILPSDALGFHNTKNGSKENSSYSSSDSRQTADALLARLFYSYDNRYMLTTSIRRDGYSAFGASNPYATFPSVALAWSFADESFFKWNHIMSTGKLDRKSVV